MESVTVAVAVAVAVAVCLHLIIVGTLFALQQVKWSLDWKRRRVVLSQGQLSYFKAKSDLQAVPLGQVPINAMTSLIIRDRAPSSPSHTHTHSHLHLHPLLKRLESNDHNASANKSKHFVVSGIKSSGQPYVLQFMAQTAEDREEWLAAIQVLLLVDQKN